MIMEHEMRKDIDKVKNFLKENSEEKLNISVRVYEKVCLDELSNYL